MRTSDFDYDLPRRLIAQAPLPERDASRLLVLPTREGEPEDRRFLELPGLLSPGDLLIANDVRVFPARLWGRKSGSGGRVEVLLLEALGGGSWRAMAGASKSLRQGAMIEFDGEGAALGACVRSVHGDGFVTLGFEISDDELLSVLEEGKGEVPLPPYISRDGDEGSRSEDKRRYQTIFARRTGAVAAPTAGLHFTEGLLSALAEEGIAVRYLTLNVGPGTFLPVRADDVADHVMHAERFDLPGETAEAIDQAKSRGGRVIAVGTTSLRALEASASAEGRVRPGAGETDLFVKPGYRVKVVDGLITNFHLPRSTLLMLVCALAGTERVLAAYREAVDREYRFYSYGDAMLLL